MYNKCTSNKFNNYFESDEEMRILGYCYFNNEILYEKDNKLYLENVNKNKSVEIDSNGYSINYGNNCEGKFYNNYFYFVREEDNIQKLYVIDLTNKKIKKCYDFDQEVNCIKYLIPSNDELIMVPNCDISIVDYRIIIKYNNGSIEKKEELTSIEDKDEVYTAKIVDDNGMIFGKQIVSCDDEVVLPNLPDKEGYEFIGFDKNFAYISQDTTYTAMYKIIKKNKYQEVYDAIKNIMDAYNNAKKDDAENKDEQTPDIGQDSEASSDNKNSQDTNEDEIINSDTDKKTEETNKDQDQTNIKDEVKEEQNDQNDSEQSNTLDNRNVVIVSIGVILAAAMMTIIIKKER